MTRDELGQVVRNAWVDRCKLKPNPNPDHLLPWREMTEFDRETDRCIGEAVEQAVAGPLRPLADWHEDDGIVLWWKLPIDEPPYVGSPLCSDWPDEADWPEGYYTHWQPIPMPKEPS